MGRTKKTGFQETKRITFTIPLYFHDILELIKTANGLDSSGAFKLIMDSFPKSLRSDDLVRQKIENIIRSVEEEAAQTISPERITQLEDLISGFPNLILAWKTLKMNPEMYEYQLLFIDWVIDNAMQMNIQACVDSLVPGVKITDILDAFDAEE